MGHSDIDILDLVHQFERDYAIGHQPIRIDFRKLFPQLNKSELYTHQIHSYPAKLIPHIPYFFLSTDYFCPDDGTVLDPFCGSGTVLLEAQLANRKAIGADANPLAVKISEIKTSKQDCKLLRKELENLLINAKQVDCDNEEINADILYWYSQNAFQQLRILEQQIALIENSQVRAFFEICLSNISKKVSIADPNISVPVRLNPERFKEYPSRYNDVIRHLEQVKYIDVFEKFYQICEDNIERIETLNVIPNLPTAKIVSNDARRLTTNVGSSRILPNESVDLIVTSPPYAGAQKYIRSSRLNLYWLGIQDTSAIHRLQEKNIGREDYHKSEIYEVKTGIESADAILHELYAEGKKERSFIVGNYLLEMQVALDESFRVLKDGGYMVIVIGNNTVCGRPFDTQDYLTTYLCNKGMQLQFKLIDDIKSYGLMTKRNRTASRIASEWVLVFKK